jgi:hypothetical protein
MVFSRSLIASLFLATSAVVNAQEAYTVGFKWYSPGDATGCDAGMQLELSQSAEAGINAASTAIANVTEWIDESLVGKRKLESQEERDLACTGYCTYECSISGRERICNKYCSHQSGCLWQGARNLRRVRKLQDEDLKAVAKDIQVGCMRGLRGVEGWENRPCASLIENVGCDIEIHGPDFAIFMYGDGEFVLQKN